MSQARGINDERLAIRGAEAKEEERPYIVIVPSSSLSTSSTYLRCSKEFAKLLVLRGGVFVGRIKGVEVAWTL